MACLSCGQGFHTECRGGEESCCGKTSLCSNSRIDDLVVELPVGGSKKVGRPRKSDNDVQDPYSTGRRRAHAEYPLDREAPCEWQGKANVGGGLFPVVGCLNGKQEEIQHGPIKDTMVNSRENIHRICRRCHRLWHAWNDAVYNPEIFALPENAHDPREADREELRKWSTSKTRPKPPNLRAGSFQRKSAVPPVEGT